MKIYAAPLQGFTQAPWRMLHRQLSPGDIDAYLTPFLRAEGDEPRARDLRDIASPLNEGVPTVAQIAARDAAEFALLADAAAEAGATRIDLNAGCPYPMLTRKGRGAALTESPDSLAAIGEEMRRCPDVTFSLKMRLGLTDPSAWRRSADVIAAMPLAMVTVHPRVARQLYKGELHLDEFGAMTGAWDHPTVYNGDLTTPADIDAVAARFPSIAGVMLGRGLLARPTLAAEWRSGSEAAAAARVEAWLQLHSCLLDHFEATLCGAAQILSKIKPYLDYAPEELLPPRALKPLRKASTTAAYRFALGAIRPA